jgi:hypothetical protein
MTATQRDERLRELEKHIVALRGRGHLVELYKSKGIVDGTEAAQKRKYIACAIEANKLGIKPGSDGDAPSTPSRVAVAPTTLSAASQNAVGAQRMLDRAQEEVQAEARLAKIYYGSDLIETLTKVVKGYGASNLVKNFERAGVFKLKDNSVEQRNLIASVLSDEVRKVEGLDAHRATAAPPAPTVVTNEQKIAALRKQLATATPRERSVISSQIRELIESNEPLPGETVEGLRAQLKLKTCKPTEVGRINARIKALLTKRS